MFDLEYWLAAQHAYDAAQLLSKRSARLSLQNESAFHKIKWGQTEKETYFIKKEAVWLSRIERKDFFVRQILYTQNTSKETTATASLEQTLKSTNITLLLQEYTDGVSVSDVLKSPIGKTFFGAPSNRHPFILSLLKAIESLHHQGIVHGDIKAANVILATDNTAKLIDFAAADWIGASNSNKPFLMKTLSYSLPDKYANASILPVVDWYAFFIIVDLVHASAPVTLKQYDLKYYLKHHENRIREGAFGRDIKQRLEKVFTELMAYLVRISSEH